MKKFFNVMILTLAVNFLALGGAVGWLYQSGHLNKDRVKQVKAILFPPATQPATQPSEEEAESTPGMNFDELLGHHQGVTTAQQVAFIKQSFDVQLLELDQRQRELSDLQRQVDLANQKLAADRDALNKRQSALDASEKEAAALENDKGFQDSLALYIAMPAGQVKSIFMTLDEPTVERYLDAMEPRTAAKIIKEFKAPEETAFIQRVLERMREASVSVSDGK